MTQKLYTKIRTPRGAIRFVPLLDASGRAIADQNTARRFTCARDAQQFAERAITQRAERVAEIMAIEDRAGALTEIDKRLFDPKQHA